MITNNLITARYSGWGTKPIQYCYNIVVKKYIHRHYGNKGSGRCAVLFKIIVGSIKPKDRMNDSVLRNMCPVSLFVSKTH